MSYPMVQQPEDYKVSLFPHQLTSIYKMEEMESKVIYDPLQRDIHAKIGILTDPVGYGKTLSVIGLLIRNKMEWETRYPYTLYASIADNCPYNMNVDDAIYKKLNANLILVSTSILNQWETELSKSPLKYTTISTKRQLESIDLTAYTEKLINVLVTPGMYNKVVDKYRDYAWCRFIYDEPDQIRFSMKHIAFKFMWMISATPDRIYNVHRKARNVNFMNGITKAIAINNADYSNRPHGSDNAITVRNDLGYVKESFNMPVVHIKTYKCLSTASRLVGGLASIRVSELIDAEDISGAISILGGTKTDSIADLVKKNKQDELKIAESELSTRIFDNSSGVIINNLIDRIENLTRNLIALEERYKDMVSGDCSICMDTLETPTMEPSCQNVFCAKCIMLWLDRSDKCPLCRVVVDKKQLLVQSSDEKNHQHLDPLELKSHARKYTKVEQIKLLVKGKPNGKFIVFSNFGITFTSIRNGLDEGDVNHTELTGTAVTRKKKLYNFKHGDINVLFLNSTNNGAGINLPEATDIIIYHDLIDDVYTQVVGRAMRVGRTQPLTVHKLQ